VLTNPYNPPTYATPIIFINPPHLRNFMGVKPFTKTNQSYLLVSTIILILILLTFFLLQSPFTSSLNINSKSKAIPKTPYPGCLPPVSISQDRYPLALYGSNLVYSKLNTNNGGIRWNYEQDRLYVWNIGPDYKPNTVDDLTPIQINATGVVLKGFEEDYGDASPKISDRYIVWTNPVGNNYNINVIDMGLDGILNSTESSNPRVIYSVPVIHSIPYSEARVNSINLKGSKVSFTYNSIPTSNSPINPEIGFCDLSLSSGIGSCSQNNVIIFTTGNYSLSKMTGDAYFYLDQNQNIQVLFGEATYSIPGNRYSPVNYSISSWNPNSVAVTLVHNQIELTDLHESLAIISYQNKIYGYFYPGSIPGNLITLSRGQIDTNPKVNVRNDFSSLGNYLVAYSKVTNNTEDLYLGSLGNGLELKTPFGFIEKPLLDSSSSGNYLYVHEFSGSRYDLYFTECFGI